MTRVTSCSQLTKKAYLDSRLRTKSNELDSKDVFRPNDGYRDGKFPWDQGHGCTTVYSCVLNCFLTAEDTDDLARPLPEPLWRGGRKWYLGKWQFYNGANWSVKAVTQVPYKCNSRGWTC
ncbi:hypothetical protein J6590_047509 [Homalodisca vitripennis]|nr:hypothetical protein J6590_047509 [Homalodisca vitripennis]